MARIFLTGEHVDNVSHLVSEQLLRSNELVQDIARLSFQRILSQNEEEMNRS